MSSKALVEKSLVNNSREKRKIKMSAMAKTTLREITRTLGRFISILCLIALGVFAYVGISITGTDMRYTAITYSNDHKLADIFIQSPLGLDKTDVDTLNAFHELKHVEYGYSTDVSAVNANVKDNHIAQDESTLKIESLPQTLSQYEVVEGRLPANVNEIILDNTLAQKYKIGDTISLLKTFPSDTSLTNLTRDNFEVVGFANSPEYLSVRIRGMSAMGKGDIDGFAGILPEAFKMSAYTIGRAESTLVNKSLTDKDTYDNQIKTQIAKIKDKMNDDSTASTHLNQLRNDLKQKITTSETELEQAKEMLGETSPEVIKAQKELDMARQQLEKLEKPAYVVNGRNHLVGYDVFFDNGARLDVLAYIFPVFLFFIAALVTSTTMKRMVEEQRQQIGTMKALGYGTKSIMEKYLVYGMIPGTIGIILGVSFGLTVLPRLIYTAYKPSYIFNDLQLQVTPHYVAIGVIIAIFCTVMPVIFAVNSSLREKAAELMRPKAPKSGKRILLERLSFLWKHMSFSAKVTARNIFRYKERMLMTIIGVAGSIALIIMGTGIRDSLTTTIDRQLNQIYHFDILTRFNEQATDAMMNEYDAIIKQNTAVAAAGKTIYDLVDVPIEGKEDMEMILVVPEVPADLSKYIEIIDNENEQIPITDNGVILSQKMAERKGINIGDEIEFSQNEKTYKAKVAAINQWYFSEQVVFSPAYYKTVFGKAPIYNSYLLNIPNKDAIQRVLSDLKNTEANLSSTSLDTMNDLAKGNLDGLNLVMVVLLVLSILLAVIVLYNLTNINVSERIRELSTIKVLGFYPLEVTRYVYRETLILSVMGIIIGWFLGTALEQFVIIEIPPEKVLFYRGIYWTNYAIASAIILSVALVIMVVMHIKLKNVNMLDALKSVE